jgi:transcriptional regulator with XRE-family HTH domain
MKTRMSLLSLSRATHLNANLLSRCFGKLRNNALENHNYFVNKYTVLNDFCKFCVVYCERPLKTQWIMKQFGGPKSMREGLTGSRIRERRAMAGLKQAELASRIGISASYLNLIEHNRRRIGGKLLLNIASNLGVEASALTEGAEAALVAKLREAAAATNLPKVDIDTADEFAGRFPDWAEVLAAGYRRIGTLERTVETLSDRLAHDPKLATSVHELLSTAASIRSTASILADDKKITTEWRDRFHGNLDQDSKRLAQSSKSLVNYLDNQNRDQEGHAIGSPQEEVDAFLSEHNYFFDEIESGAIAVDALVEQSERLVSGSARHIAHGILNQIALDAESVNLEQLQDQIHSIGLDPIQLSKYFSVPVSTILRRLSSLSSLKAGLVVCDRTGSLLFRKPTKGFTIPRFDALCALLPLFDALNSVAQISRNKVAVAGRSEVKFEVFSVAEPVSVSSYNDTPLIQATMLVVPLRSGQISELSKKIEIGATCRVCSRGHCPARREPSILSSGF